MHECTWYGTEYLKHGVATFFSELLYHTYQILVDMFPFILMGWLPITLFSIIYYLKNKKKVLTEQDNKVINLSKVRK
ncbi:hypothetical protein CN495_08060 [Bacillus thuringiensis]|uniref:Uncharacterized protein n=1 Tax=Bacillus thuringiensis TaxID=1428 RepID=A0ABD6SKV8_BACTU|nr:hypothetical protein CN495_08060 [Bacillus thuringiensis]